MPWPWIRPLVFALGAFSLLAASAVAAHAQEFGWTSDDDTEGPLVGAWHYQARAETVVHIGTGPMGFTLGNDHAVSYRGAPLLVSRPSTTHTALHLFPNPQSDWVVAMQTDDAGVGIRFAVVELATGASFGADAVGSANMQGLIDARDVIQIAPSVSWSPDGHLAALAYSTSDHQSTVLVVDTATRDLMVLEPELEDGAWPSVNLDRIRQNPFSGAHEIDFDVLKCFSDPCFDFGRRNRVRLVLEDGWRVRSEYVASPYRAPEGSRWLQTHSMNDIDAALSMARSLAAAAPDLTFHVFRSLNGVYAIANGPLQEPEWEFIEDMKTTYGLPADAYLTEGKTYMQRMHFEPDDRSFPFRRSLVLSDAEVFLGRDTTDAVERLEAGTEIVVWAEEGPACAISAREPLWTACANLDGFGAGREDEVPAVVPAAAAAQEVGFDDALLAEMRNELAKITETSTPAEVFQTFISLLDHMITLAEVAGSSEAFLSTVLSLREWSDVLSPQTMSAIEATSAAELLDGSLGAVTLVGGMVGHAILEKYVDPHVPGLLSHALHQSVDGAATLITGGHPVIFGLTRVAEVLVELERLERQNADMISREIAQARVFLAAQDASPTIEWGFFSPSVQSNRQTATDLMTGNGLNVHAGRQLHIVTAMFDLRSRQLSGLDTTHDIDLIDMQVRDFDATPGNPWNAWQEAFNPLGLKGLKDYAGFASGLEELFGIERLETAMP